MRNRQGTPGLNRKGQSLEEIRTRIRLDRYNFADVDPTSAFSGHSVQ